MKSSPIIIAALVALSLAIGRAHAEPHEGSGRVAEAAIKPGSWEFTARLSLRATAPPPSNPNQSADGQRQSDDGLVANYRMCIDARRAIPSALTANCSLEARATRGAEVTWSTVCTNAQSTVHSVGTAQYHGDTMAATLVNHLPGNDGRVTDVSQRISGRYVGPCTENAVADAGSAAAPVAPSATQPAPATAGVAVTGENPPATRNRHYSRHARRLRHYRRYHRYYAGPPNILALPFIGLRGLLGR